MAKTPRWAMKAASEIADRNRVRKDYDLPLVRATEGAGIIAREHAAALKGAGNG